MSNKMKDCRINEREEFFQKMTELKVLYFKFEKELRNWDAIIPSVFESPLIETAHSYFEFSLDMICDRFNISQDSMTWFIWDCEWGNKPQIVTVNGKDYKVKDIKSFYNSEKEMR